MRQRASRNVIQQAVIRLSPAGLHKGAQVSLHAAARCVELLCRLLIEPLRDQQDILRLFLYLLQHIYREVKSRQLSGYTQEAQQAFGIQSHVLFKFRNIINSRHWYSSCRVYFERQPSSRYGGLLAEFGKLLRSFHTDFTRFMAICVMYSFYNGLRKCDGFCVFLSFFSFSKLRRYGSACLLSIILLTSHKEVI